MYVPKKALSNTRMAPIIRIPAFYILRNIVKLQ